MLAASDGVLRNMTKKVIILQDFKQLAVWQKAYQLTLSIYQTTQAFPKEEAYGLTSQMRRSSASIPTNIAEGCGRDSNPEFVRFLAIAMGSASELECQLMLSRDLNMMDSGVYEVINRDLIEVKRMLTGLIHKIKNTYTKR